MVKSHITLRLPADLARVVTDKAREAGVAKSHLVREAVASYLKGRPSVAPPRITAAELAGRWATFPRLTPSEASDLADDVAAARAALPPPPTSWA
ncbi:MAG: CopG family transcriptional regulator [Gemmatimonadales bacterium]